MLYTRWASIVFSPKQIHLPELPAIWLPWRWPVIFYWSSRKVSKRKTKTCYERGDTSNLTCHSRRRKCLQHARRQVVSVLFAPTAHVKVKSDSSLNPLWTSLTACVIWNAPLPPNPELLSCFTTRPASDGDLVPLWNVTERRWDLLVRCLKYSWLFSLDSASSVSSSQESHWAMMWFLVLRRVWWASNHHMSINNHN